MELLDLQEREEPLAPKQNIQAVVLHYYPDRFVLEMKNQAAQNLLILRASGEHSLERAGQSPAEKVRPFSCYLGMIQIFSSWFLLFVDEARVACNLEGHNIFEVVQVSFVPLKEEKELGKDPRWPQTSHFLSSIRRLLSFGFYFCFTMDLTLSRQAFAGGEDTDMLFCWNQHLAARLLPFREWFTPLIQGFVKQADSYLSGKKIIHTLISRRAWVQGGTRFYSRGIDGNGVVANFVETENIVSHAGKLCAHVQVRGSVPCFWRQSGHIQIEIDLTRKEEPTR
jgi:hypothetical protein